ncbi:hypothetical protein C8J57DRAFT_1473713 [Mycena rebaudengoi]|nr:hypothetical protein C8J57DRAFT_1473713 [Mycena rebaudengoi]
MIMVEQIHEILCAITTLCSTSEIKGVLATAVLYDIAKFTEYVVVAFFWVTHTQQKMGKIKQLFKQPDNAEKLETCKQELNRAIRIFRVRAGDSTLAQIGNVKKEAKQRHDELMALLNAHLDLSSSDRSSVTGTLSSSANSLLPASPKIFHGRESELKDVVNVLLQNSARVAILGTGGMGKTSLATAALHNPQVEARAVALNIRLLALGCSHVNCTRIPEPRRDARHDADIVFRSVRFPACRFPTPIYLRMLSSHHCRAAFRPHRSATCAHPPIYTPCTLLLRYWYYGTHHFPSSLRRATSLCRRSPHVTGAVLRTLCRPPHEIRSQYIVQEGKFYAIGLVIIFLGLGMLANACRELICRELMFGLAGRSALHGRLKSNRAIAQGIGLGKIQEYLGELP